MPGRNTGQEKVFAFSIVYLTGCTPLSECSAFLLFGDRALSSELSHDGPHRGFALHSGQCLSPGSMSLCAPRGTALQCLPLLHGTLFIRSPCDSGESLPNLGAEFSRLLIRRVSWIHCISLICRVSSIRRVSSIHCISLICRVSSIHCIS